MANGTKRIVKAEDFWGEREAAVVAFEAGTDPGATFLASIEEAEEKVVEV